MKNKEIIDVEDTVSDKASVPELSIDRQDDMNWWPELSDLDRLNVLGAPREDRARVLASKDSRSVEVTMKEIARKSGYFFVEDYNLSKNPTNSN